MAFPSRDAQLRAKYSITEEIYEKILVAQKDLATKLEELERKYEGHDKQIQSIFLAIRKLMEPPALLPKRQIGFHVGEPKVKYGVIEKTK